MFDEWKKLRNCVQTYSPVCTAQRNLNILKLTTRLWVAALASTNMYPLLPLDGGESWEDHIRNTIIHEALENPALEGLRVCQLKHPIGFTLWAAMVSISDLKVLVGIAFYCWIGEWKMRFQVSRNHPPRTAHSHPADRVDLAHSLLAVLGAHKGEQNSAFIYWRSLTIMSSCYIFLQCHEAVNLSLMNHHLGATESLSVFSIVEKTLPSARCQTHY